MGADLLSARRGFMPKLIAHLTRYPRPATTGQSAARFRYVSLRSVPLLPAPKAARSYHTCSTSHKIPRNRCGRSFERPRGDDDVALLLEDPVHPVDGRRGAARRFHYEDV